MTTNDLIDQDSRIANIGRVLRTLVDNWLQVRGWRGDFKLLRDDSAAASGCLFSPTDSAMVLQLGELHGTPLALSLELSPEATATAADWVLLQSHLKSVLWINSETSQISPPVAGDWVLARRIQVEELLHDLGNRLNSLMANAGVLATAHRGEDRLASFAQQTARDSDDCVQAVARLSQTLLELRT